MFVKGHPLKCPHCGSTNFSHERAKLHKLHTEGSTFFKLNWLNQSADTFICAECGRIEWFLDTKVQSGGNPPKPSRPKHEPKSGGRECTRCGVFVSRSVALCPNCGKPS